MEKFVASWNDGKTVPKSYVFPPGQRPGEHVAPKSKHHIPVIDLGKIGGIDHASILQQIIKASHELGAFQVINHGVPRSLMDDARCVFKEFFKLPAGEKSRFCSSDYQGKFIMYTSTVNYDKEEVHLWRDSCKLKCTPLEECVPYWPEKPATYRETVRDYSIKVTELGSRILDLMCEGIGVDPGCFRGEIRQDVEIIANHYPACPDPSLTLGVGRHSDRSLITLLMQDHVPGLQIYKDGGWIGVDPNPDAFVIHLGNIMQIASNGKLRNGDHRAVTNADEDRESVAVFLIPTLDCLIEPAKALLNAQDRPLYRSLRYHEYLASHDTSRRLKDPDLLLKPFLIEDPKSCSK